MVIAGTMALAGVLAALAVQGWTLFHLQRQQTRLQQRLSDVGRRLVVRSAAPVRVVEPPADAGGAAPPFDLVALDGRRVTRDDLLASGKSVLLVVADPRCGPCYELLPDVGGWQRVYGDRLTIALVSAGEPGLNRAMTEEYGIAPGSVLLQTEHELAETYGLPMAPAAVLIHPDGRRGEPAFGAPAVRQLVAAALGLKVPEAFPKEMRALEVGERAPHFRRSDLGGNLVELGGIQTAPTILLFWSPGCRHCQEILPQIKAWEAQPGAPRLLVVSRGPVTLNQQAGFASPLVLDDDRSVAEAFGVAGTPAAVLIDALGVVAAPVVRGTCGVRALANQHFMPCSAFAIETAEG